MDRLHSGPLACPRVHVNSMHNILHLYTCVGQPDWTEIFCLLYVLYLARQSSPNFLVFQISRVPRTQDRPLLSRMYTFIRYLSNLLN
jgi:hypothetical protein